MGARYTGMNETGRVLATTEEERFAGPDWILIEYPDDFDFEIQDQYRVVDGELIHDPLPEPADIQIARLKNKLAETDYAVIKVYEAMVIGEALPDEDAARYSEMISQRQEWRSRINELEASLEGGEADGGTVEVGSDVA